MPPQDPQDKNTCDPNDPNDGSEGNQGSGSPSGASDPSDDSDPTPTPEATQAAQDNDESGSENDNTPTPAPVTNDSHRLTMSVPHEEETVFNLGTGAPFSEETIVDNGITGRTKSHVHFHTTEGETKTMLALGTGSLEGWSAYKGNHVAANTGFMFVTASAAWMESAEQMYLVSSGESVIVRTGVPEKEGGEQKILVQSDKGDVWVGAGKGVLVAGKGEVSICANSSLGMSDAEYKGEITETLEQTTGTFWTSWVATAADGIHTLATIAHAVHEASHNYKKGRANQKGFMESAGLEAGEAASEIAKLALSAWTGALGKLGSNVEIHASDNVGVAAGQAVELFGKLGAGLSSLAATDVLGATVGVKSLTYADLVAGLLVAIKGGKEVSISSGKETKIKSKGEIAIAATEGVTVLAETEDLVLQAAKKHAVLFGEEAVYVASNGYGMKATESGLSLGKMSSPGDFEAAKGDDSSLLKMDDSSIEARNKGAFVQLMNGNIEIANSDSVSIQLQGSTFRVTNGSKILLD